MGKLRWPAKRCKLWAPRGQLRPGGPASLQGRRYKSRGPASRPTAPARRAAGMGRRGAAARRQLAWDAGAQLPSAAGMGRRARDSRHGTPWGPQAGGLPGAPSSRRTGPALLKRLGSSRPLVRFQFPFEGDLFHYFWPLNLAEPWPVSLLYRRAGGAPQLRWPKRPLACSAAQPGPPGPPAGARGSLSRARSFLRRGCLAVWAPTSHAGAAIWQGAPIRRRRHKGREICTKPGPRPRPPPARKQTGGPPPGLHPRPVDGLLYIDLPKVRGGSAPASRPWPQGPWMVCEASRHGPQGLARQRPPRAPCRALLPKRCKLQGFGAVLFTGLPRRTHDSLGQVWRGRGALSAGPRTYEPRRANGPPPAQPLRCLQRLGRGQRLVWPRAPLPSYIRPLRLGAVPAGIRHAGGLSYTGPGDLCASFGAADWLYGPPTGHAGAAIWQSPPPELS